MAKRHFLMQPHKHQAKHVIAGQMVSEKLDGQRAYWDGGISRGMLAKDVPWANTAKDCKDRLSTGLWSRYGKPIAAPDWWLDKLPEFPLDGELWCGFGQFQKVSSAVRKHIPVDSEWEDVTYMAYDIPEYYDIFYDSIIDIPNYYKDLNGIWDWIIARTKFTLFSMPYREVYIWLNVNINKSKYLNVVQQLHITHNPEKAKEQLEVFYQEVLSHGGEGVILRDPNATYLPERVHHMTKIKPFHDDEATVVGYITGRDTNKGGKLLGLMGAMIVEWKGKRFKLSGFTDEERKLTQNSMTPSEFNNIFDDAECYAVVNPESQCPDFIEATNFPRGTIITFRYRELSDDGIPKDARYLRKYEVI